MFAVCKLFCLAICVLVCWIIVHFDTVSSPNVSTATPTTQCMYMHCTGHITLPALALQLAHETNQ